MQAILRPGVVGILSLALAAAPAVTAVAKPVTAASVPATSPAAGPAPGAPGTPAGLLPATKSGFGTAHNRTSKVWFTVQKQGGLGEIFYPDVSSPAARALQFVVA